MMSNEVSSPHSKPRPFDWRRFLERHGAILALVVLVVGTAILEFYRVEPDSRAFLKPQNFLNIFRQMSFVGIVAIGMTYVIILGGIDLSVGAMVALLGGAAIYAMNAAASRWGEGWGIAAAVGVCLLGGPVLGLVNGLVIAWGRIAPFVATLGTMVAFRSLILAPAEGSEIRSTVPAYNAIGSGGITVPWIQIGDGVPLILQYPVVTFLAVAALAHMVLAKTAFGMNVYAIGDNTRAARYAGVKVERATAAVYSICGLTCGVAALLSSSRLNSVSSSSLGLFYELDAIAAVVIGGTRLQGGAGRILGTVVGVLIIGVVGNMLNMLQVSTHYQGLVKGLIIIGAVLIQPRKSGE